MRKVALAVAVLGCLPLAILGGACASLTDQATEAREAKEYRTGSNLPVRDRSGPDDRMAVDRSENTRRIVGCLRRTKK